MATVAKYVFQDRASAEAARDKINYEIGSGSASCYGDEVEIYDNCRDLSSAAQICQAYGGSPR